MRRGIPAILWLVGVGLVTPAQAGRRAGMAGNRLIEDVNDVYAFPQLVLKYRDFIGFDYGPADGSGSALMLIGDEDLGAMGLAIHRGDAFNPHELGRGPVLATLGDPPNPLAAGRQTALTPPLTVVDLLLATGDFGVRLALGNGEDSVEPDQLPGDRNKQTVVMLEMGYSSHDEALRIDTSLSLLADFASQEIQSVAALEGQAEAISLTTRIYLPVNDRMELGLLGDFAFGHVAEQEQQGDETERIDNTLAVRAGFGPVYRIDEAATVAGYLTLGYERGKHDEGDRSQIDQRFVVPGANIAAEVALSEWLFFRSGARYRFAFDQSDQKDIDTREVRSAMFSWNAGIGLKIDDFTLDGSFEHAFMTQGPDFLGGDGRLFGLASARYRF